MNLRSSRDRWRGCLFGLLVLVAVVALTGAYLRLYADYAGPTQVMVGNSGEPLAGAAYVPTQEQTQVLAELGPPESFTILFYQEPGADGPEEIRFEVWRYPAAGREIAFVNGEVASDSALEAPSKTMDPSPFLPDQFGAYMNLEELIHRTGITSYVRAASEPELAAGGELYFADGLAFAMQHGRLVAVEALALEAQG